MNELSKTIIGNEEWFSFRGLAIPAIKARIDTGAATTALHAFDIEEFEKDSEVWVRFNAHPLQKDKKTTIPCEAPVLAQRKVKSSSGHPEKRFVVSSEITYQNVSWPIEITLTNRDSMGYRMLLGRQAMQGRFLVDPGESFLLGKLSKAEVKALYSSL